MAIGVNQIHATNEKISLQYDMPHKTSTAGMIYYNLTKVELKITNIQILSMDDTPDYEADNADLVKITISVTNNGLERFMVLDKMFELWITESSKKDPEKVHVIDNYDTSYDDQLEVTYEKMNSRELYNECDQTIDSIKTGESLSFTLCYDILKSRNAGGVILDGPKKYLLIMMDNQQSTSCPNCKKIVLTKDSGPPTQIMPKWVSKLLDWNEKHLISKEEFQRALDYLVSMGIIRNESRKSPDDLTRKNNELAEYQDTLSNAYNKNLFVSAIHMLESKHPNEFTGVICKKQNSIITLDADYTNDNVQYDVVFFRLKVFDESGNKAAEGLSKIVDVAPKSFRHLSISVPAIQNPSYCTVNVDSKFS
jgi:hypothetical protein